MFFGNICCLTCKSYVVTKCTCMSIFFGNICCLTCNVCDVRDGDPKSDTARDKLALESLAHQILWCQKVITEQIFWCKKVLLTRYSDVKESCTPDTWILKCLAHQIPLCQNFITDQILWCQSGITEQKDQRPTSVLLEQLFRIWKVNDIHQNSSFWNLALWC